MFHYIGIRKNFIVTLYTGKSCPDTNKGSNLLKSVLGTLVASVHSAGKVLVIVIWNIEYFSVVSFTILQSKPAIGLFIDANLIINCSFYGLTTQVISTGTEHLTGQMIKHSLLQIAKGQWKPNQLLPWSGFNVTGPALTVS